MFAQLVLQGMQSTLFAAGLYPGRQWQIEELLLRALHWALNTVGQQQTKIECVEQLLETETRMNDILFICWTINLCL